MGNENHMSTQLWWEEFGGRGLACCGRGLSGATLDIISLSEMTSSKTLQPLMLEVTSLFWEQCCFQSF